MSVAGAFGGRLSFLPLGNRGTEWPNSSLPKACFRPKERPEAPETAKVPPPAQCRTWQDSGPHGAIRFSIRSETLTAHHLGEAQKRLLPDFSSRPAQGLARAELR